MTLSSEADFLRLIDRHFPDPSGLKQGKVDMQDTVQLGRGDDCAILRFGDLACLSSDIFLEDVHFRRSYFSPEDIGHKALAVNISDVAAMGCEPVGFALDLMVPDALEEPWFDKMLAGMATLAEEHALPLVGGDLSRAPMLGLTVHIWGRPGPSGRMLRRGGAQPGDLLAVVGSLGLARVGLLELERMGRSAMQSFPEATAQHLRPRPRVAEGLALADLTQTRGLMDISDGLARDLPRFLALSEGRGADLQLSPDMLHPEVVAYGRQSGESPAMTAMLGGEDYGLLAALAPDFIADATALIPDLHIIGTVTDRPEIRLNSEPFNLPGFDHFGSS